MIRRHALWFRALLIAADAVLAVGLLVALSAWRFGPDWVDWSRQIVPQPVAFLVLYAATWIAVLTLNGLYRPRARWTLRSEAVAVVRATVVMALVTLSVLFLLNLPDVSRSLLLVLFPALALLTILVRAAMRSVLERYRREGHNLRFVLVLGAGPRGQAFAAKLEGHRELGLRVIGFLDSDPDIATSDRWPLLGSLDDIETILHTTVVDEVVICLPFSLWDRIDAIAGLCEEEGKIVRIPMDVMDRAISAGRVEELDGTPVFSLVSGPDRALALATKRGARPPRRRASGLVLLSPILLAIAIAIALDGGRPILFRQTRIGLHGRPFSVVKFRSMVPDAEARRAGLSDQQRAQRPGVQGRGRPARDGDRAVPAAHVARRAAPAVERVPRPDEPRRPAAAAPRRGRRLRPVAPPPAVDEARHHRPVAGPRPPRPGLRPLGRGRPRVHRQVVAVARRPDPVPHDPGSAGRSIVGLLRRKEPGAPALIPDIVEAARLGDGAKDKVRFVGTLAIKKLGSWHLMPDPGRHEITISSHGSRFTLDLWAGEHRPLREIVARDEYSLATNPPSTGSTVVDVGANVGIFTVLAAKAVGPTGRVVAFEPHPGAYQRLVKNVRQNGLSDFVTCVNAAASAEPGQIAFSPAALSVQNKVTSSDDDLINVEAMPLDAYFEEPGPPRISLLKVDVEGHEAEVIKGGQRTLAEVDDVRMEYHSDDLKVEVVGQLKRAGFTIDLDRPYGAGSGLIRAHRA